MEDRLLKLFECARIEGSTEKEMLAKLYGDSSGKAVRMPEYEIARKNGLNIIQAELAALISQELKTRGFDNFLLRFECIREGRNSSYLHKKRQRKTKEEPSLQKKSKY